jgi:hypothetical protein
MPNIKEEVEKILMKFCNREADYGQTVESFVNSYRIALLLGLIVGIIMGMIVS